MSWFWKSRSEMAWETVKRQHAEADQQLALTSNQQEVSRLQQEEFQRQLEASRHQLEDRDRQLEASRHQTEEYERQLLESDRLTAETAKIREIELQNAERASRILDNAELLMIRFSSCLTQLESRFNSLDNTSGNTDQ